MRDVTAHAFGIRKFSNSSGNSPSIKKFITHTQWNQSKFVYPIRVYLYPEYNNSIEYLPRYSPKTRITAHPEWKKLKKKKLHNFQTLSVHTNIT